MNNFVLKIRRRQHTQSITLHHIPEDLNPEQLCCKDINIEQKFKKVMFLCYYNIKTDFHIGTKGFLETFVPANKISVFIETE